MKCIAISGLSGSGKTSLINELALMLPNVKVLSFDDYDFDQQINNYYELLLDSMDYNLLDLTALKHDILSSTNYDFILLDYPFSYKQKMISPYISLSVYLDTPFDVALSRRLLRDHQDNEHLLIALHQYLNHSRQIFVNYHHDMMLDCDIILDGQKDSKALAYELIEIIHKSLVI